MSVQIGYLAELGEADVSRTDWVDWDGGLAGGQPIFFKTITQSLSCAECNGKVKYLLQVNCPLDGTNKNAYYRILTIFVCEICKSVQVLKQQHSKNLEIKDTDNFDEDNFKSFSDEKKAINIEEENAEIEESYQTNMPISSEIDLEDTKITQTDLNKIATSRTLLEEDEVFDKFEHRIKRNPDQVLRYNTLFSEPQTSNLDHHLSQILFPTNKLAKETHCDILCLQSSIKSFLLKEENLCKVCKSPRKFEFQIMPQLISVMQIGDLLDFASILIFSCPKTCDNEFELAFTQQFDSSTSPALESTLAELDLDQ